MSPKQKKILKIAIGIIVLMLVFPPFNAGIRYGQTYDFLLSPATDGAVNIGLLLVQWLGVAIVGAGLIFAAKD